MAKVTVAIPTYNRKDQLIESIESVLAQTFQDFSAVIFDNASNYDVRAVLGALNDDRISVIVSPANVGNYNRVFEYLFDSEYVVIFHDDDVMHPELLAREVAIMDLHPELAWVGTDLQFVHDSNKMHEFAPLKDGAPAICDAAEVVRYVLRGFNLCYDSVMYRAKHLEPMDSSYAKWGDRPYLVKLSKKGKAGILREQLVNYRIHSGQDSQAPAPDAAYYLARVFSYYRECLGSTLSGSDRRLLYSHIANSIIPSAIAAVHTMRGFSEFLVPFRRERLVRFHYFGMRGVYRSCKVIVQKIK